jgi:LacI family transcriptional regulator
LATIYDVAKIAGVSPKTVSRVLNGDAPVGEKTREAVEKAILELGYVPSNAARMMRSSRSGLIGLITGAISTTSDGNDPKGLPDLLIVQGIQSVMSATGMTLMIADTGGSSARVPELIRTFVEHRAEGIIYVADYHQHVELPPAPKGTPLVLVNCYDDRGTPSVLPDDERGQHDLVARLIEAGHRRIGYLTLPKGMDATRLRLEGYKRALAEAGIEFDPELISTGFMHDKHRNSAVLWDAIDRVLSLPNPPTVLCCGNDEMAMRAYGILRTRGIRMPEDISVAGYDNYRVIAETLFPPLTTAELPYAAMGARAADWLLSLINDETHQQTNPTLVSGPVNWRSSVAANASADGKTIRFPLSNGRNPQ